MLFMPIPDSRPTLQATFTASPLSRLGSRAQVRHDRGMQPDWKRLGWEFARAREAADLTQVEAAERIGVSRPTIQSIERGGPFKRITSTMRTYAQLVGWAEGSIEAVLAGGSPVRHQGSESAAGEEPGRLKPLAAAESGVSPPTRIRAEPADGEGLDPGVYDLTPEGAGEGVQLLVVVNKKGASPQGILRYLEEVKRKERLRDLVDFLRARLDSTAAQAAKWHDLECEIHARLDEGLHAASAASQTLHEVPGAACDCGGPARILAEVDAKRQLVDAYAEVADMDTGDAEPEYAYGRAAGLGLAVRLMALLYADHRDYRDEWRP